MSSSGRPTSESLSLKMPATSGLKRVMVMSASTNTVATPVARPMLSRSALTRLIKSIFSWYSALTVLSSSFTDCSSSLELCSSSLEAISSSLVACNSSLEVSSSSIVACKLSRVADNSRSSPSMRVMVSTPTSTGLNASFTVTTSASKQSMVRRSTPSFFMQWAESLTERTSPLRSVN